MSTSNSHNEKRTANSMEQAERLKAVRKSLFKNQKDASDCLGVSQGNLSEMERGNRGISKSLQEKLTFQYGINISWLITGVGEMFSDADASQNRDVEIKVSSEPSTEKKTGGADPNERLIQTLESLVESKEDQVSVLKEQNESLKEEVQRLRQEIDKKNDENFKLQREVERIEKRQATA